MTHEEHTQCWSCNIRRRIVNTYVAGSTSFRVDCAHGPWPGRLPAVREDTSVVVVFFVLNPLRLALICCGAIGCAFFCGTLDAHFDQSCINTTCINFDQSMDSTNRRYVAQWHVHFRISPLYRSGDVEMVEWRVERGGKSEDTEGHGDVTHMGTGGQVTM